MSGKHHRSPAIDVIEYLVLKKLAGRSEVLEALVEYMDGGISPSLANTIYGVSKHQLRGFVQRIYEKAGDRVLAETVVKRTTFLVISTVPSVTMRDRWPEVCRVCGKRLENVFAEDHIKKHHPDLLEHWLRKVVEELRRTLRSGRSSDYVEAQSQV